MITILLKALGLWSLLVVLAIINGFVREKMLTPMLGMGLSLPMSGILLSILILLYTWAVLPLVRVRTASGYLMIGGFWLILTILFEFVFGHFVVGDPWEKLLASYDITSGNLWVLVLVVTAAAPFTAAKIRGRV